METKFTPGPWKVHNNIGRKSEKGVVANGAPCIIAIMGNAKAYPVEADANARLIAAAPLQNNALHEALELIEIARRYFPKSMHNPDKFKLEQTCAAVGAVLAAAEKAN